MKKLSSIMLIDDDSITNFLNELLIQEMGITQELFIASDGKQALEELYSRCVLKNNCPDLILLDVNMPVVNGFDFLEKFNKLNIENRKAVIIVMLTTSLNPNDKKKAKEFNVDDYMSKPLTKKRMEELLNRYFNEAFPN